MSKSAQEGIIEKLVFGGEGLLREKGKVVFIPFTLPGEFVRYELVEERKDFARAHLLHILTPSPQRISPRCIHFGQCGGCQLQHLSYEDQLTMKHELVKETLARAGIDSLPALSIESSPSAWDYRHHITLHALPKGEEWEIGFFAAHSHRLIDLRECHLWGQTLYPLKMEVAMALSRLPLSFRSSFTVRLLKTSDQYLAVFQSRNAPTFSDFSTWGTSFLNPSSFFRGVIFNGLSLGNCEIRQPIHGWLMEYSPVAFMQNHPVMSEKIYAYIEEQIRCIAPAGVLDGYAGIGITSLSIARQGIPVISVEIHPAAVACGQQSALYHGLKGIEFITQSMEDFVRSQNPSEAPPCVVVNPPREGLSSSVVAWLLESAAEQVIYVSCHPSTLGRDLSAFKKKGWHLATLKGFDLFPQTTHVELVARMIKKK